MLSRMKRADALTSLRIAGYHADQRTFVRVYVENRISKKVADEEFRRGAAMRRAGVGCTCLECKEQNVQPRS